MKGIYESCFMFGQLFEQFDVHHKKLRNRLFISPSSYFSVSSDPKRFHYFSFFTSLLAIMAFSPASSGLYISDNKQMVACQKSRL